MANHLCKKELRKIGLDDVAYHTNEIVKTKENVRKGKRRIDKTNDLVCSQISNTTHVTRYKTICQITCVVETNWKLCSIHLRI